MNVVELISLMQLQEKREITKTELAKDLGVSYTYLQRIKNKDLPQHYIEGLEIKKGYKLQSNSPSSELHTMDDGFEIPYWEECDRFGEYTKNPDIRSVWFEKEIIKKWGRDFNDLRIINIFNSKMAGGSYPLRENDVILFDKSETNYATSGVFVFTTGIGIHRNVFICFISPNPDATGLTFKFNNPNYPPKNYTYEQVKNANLVIVGRVIKNITLTI